MTRSSSKAGVACAAFACVLFASGCPKDDEGGNASHQDGGNSGPGGGSGGGKHDGSGGASSGGHAGDDAMNGKQDAGHAALDAGSMHSGGGHDAGMGSGGAIDAGSTHADAGGASGAFHWYQTCGAPVCMADDEPFDDPNVPNCSQDQKEGAACDTKDQRCDGVAGCGAMLVCSDEDPTQGPGGCPISRARYKQDVEYLDARQLRDYHAQLMSLPLASYRYKSAPASPQLGFIIDDVEPSVAVAGDHVNMYGYLSMAVAAIQVQAQQIDALQHEVAQLRSQLASDAPAMCTQP
jgi:hypothetical protein